MDYRIEYHLKGWISTNITLRLSTGRNVLIREYQYSDSRILIAAQIIRGLSIF